jgi:hypothetical protein
MTFFSAFVGIRVLMKPLKPSCIRSAAKLLSGPTAAHPAAPDLSASASAAAACGSVRCDGVLKLLWTAAVAAAERLLLYVLLFNPLQQLLLTGPLLLLLL